MGLRNMTIDHELEKNLIEESRQQREFFEHFLGRPLYPHQQKMLDAIARGERLVFCPQQRYGKSVLLHELEKMKLDSSTPVSTPQTSTSSVRSTKS